MHFVIRREVSFKIGTFIRQNCNYCYFFQRYDDDFTQEDSLLITRNFEYFFSNIMFKKVPKVEGLRYISSDLGRESVYSNEMHSSSLLFEDIMQVGTVIKYASKVKDRYFLS